MFNEPAPRHFVSYGASDQRTIRELASYYDGILVPGTIAALQREGTAGFVLTQSARGRNTPYVIDPRFPLFQQALPFAKSSHESLAKILGDDSLVCTECPQPREFTAQRIDTIAAAWVTFNLGYQQQQSAKFEKYAKRLGTPLRLSDASGPQRILAPYFCVEGRSDPWYEKSLELYQATSAAANAVGCELDVTRIIAAHSATALADVVSENDNDDVCIWVSGLDERTTAVDELVAYASSIGRLVLSGRRSFALYGGFFAVLLTSVGLVGNSHGIGYGENRKWRELPRSGPPPARYYLPTVHRYVRQDQAEALWRFDRSLVGDGIVESPEALSYHDLMLHSVKARAAEIENFGPLSLDEAVERLDGEYRDFTVRLEASSSGLLIQRGREFAGHVPMWIRVLRQLRRD